MGWKPLDAVLYGLGDGLLSTLCSEDTPNAAARTDDGVLWFGTTKGLAKVDPSRLHENPDPPPVLVEQVRLDGEIVPGARKGISAAPGTRHVEIAYTALDLSAPEKQIFRYRMDGFDDRWIDGGGMRLASYTNLPAGRYTFIVQARSRSGIWNLRGARLSVNVRPHFYATTWFLSLAALALGLLFLTFYLMRVRMLKREFASVLAERMRSVRAQEQITAAHVSELARMNTGLRDNLAVLSSGTELKAAMEQLLKTAVEQLRADNACIFAYDEAKGILERLFVAGSDENCVYAVPPDGPLRDAYFAGCPALLQAGSVSIWQHFQTDKSLLVLDIDNEPDAAMLWPEAIRWHRENSQPTAVGVTLFLGPRMLGFMGINFTAKVTDLAFNDERRNLANSLGSLASMALESQRLALRARDAAIGEERTRLSEEMHDGIQQLFTAISFQLGGVQNMAKTGRNSADLLPQIQRTAEIAEHGLREVRRSIRALHDAAPLSERELVDALKGLCRSSESAQIRCKLHVAADLQLPTSTRLNDLYRVAQEAVNNACKHANATPIEVRLDRRGTLLELSITDDGQGFDPDSAKASGNGMRNLAERARRLHGKLTITSASGATKILLVVPDVGVL